MEAPALVHNVGPNGQSYCQWQSVTSSTRLNVTAPNLAPVNPDAADSLTPVTSNASVTSDPSSTPPPAPNPSQDQALIPNITSPTPKDAPSPPSLLTQDDEPEWDVASIPPETAMKMLARAIESLAKVTGDIPATPAASIMSKFSIGGILDSSTRPQQSTEGGRSRSDTEEDKATPLKDFKPSHSRTTSRPHTPTPVPDSDLRRPSFQPVSLLSPEASSHDPPLPPIPTPPAEELERSSSNEERRKQQVAVQRDAQTAAIARKFFSKSIPPIAIDAYLGRLQRYCPMSTAVWLAAACYISILSLPAQFGDQPLVPLTPRTTHRLLLAALRVAMKALEDLRYPQARFAGVGGVSETELKALEISLCYLMDFELQVDAVKLLRGAVKLQRATHMAEHMRSSISGPSTAKEFVLNKDALPLRVRGATMSGKAKEYH